MSEIDRFKHGNEAGAHAKRDDAPDVEAHVHKKAVDEVSPESDEEGPDFELHHHKR